MYKTEIYTQTGEAALLHEGNSISAGFHFSTPLVARLSGHVFSITPPGTRALSESYSTTADGMSSASLASSFNTRGLLTANFPDGTYRFQYLRPFSFSGSIDLSGDQFPSVPRITNFTALQSIAGGAAVVEWQRIADARPGDHIAVTVADGADLLYTAQGINAAGIADETATSAAVEVMPGRTSYVTVTVRRTTATAQSGEVPLVAGFNTTTSLWVRSTGPGDNTAPRVVSATPSADAVGVSPTTPVLLTFDEPMRPVGGLQGVRMPDGTRQRVTWSSDQRTARIEFPAPLPPGPVVLTFGPRDISGFGFRDISSNFPPNGSTAASFFVGNLPVFSRQPQRASPAPGATVTLTAAALWPPGGLTYQWFRDGVAVTGATSATLTIPSFGSAQSGLYEVRVTNAHGSTMSAPALVIADAHIYAPRASIDASEVSYSEREEPVTPGLPITLKIGGIDGGPLTSIVWRKNGVPIPGASGMTLTIPSLATTDNGTYDALISNAYTTGAAEPVVLVVRNGRTLPKYNTHRVFSVVTRGESFNLDSDIQLPVGLERGWQFNGQWIARNSTERVLRMNNLQPRDAGVYRFYVGNGVESVIVKEHTVHVAEPVAEGAPVIQGGPGVITFSETTSGTAWVFCTGMQPFSFQWRKDGADLPGETRASIRFSAEPAGQEGIYTCVVRNPVGSAESFPYTARFVSERIVPAKPRIRNTFWETTWQGFPTGADLFLSSSADYTPSAERRTQWYRDGVPIPGETSSDLRIRNIGTQHRGAYTVVYTNEYGATASDPYDVRVAAPEDAPLISRPVQTIRVKLGGDFEIFPPLTGTNLRYRWFVDGRAVTSELMANPAAVSVRVSNAQAMHLGLWTLEATNDAGTVTAPAAMVVLDEGLPASAKLANVSTRALAGQGAGTLIAGFTIAGSSSKRMLLRAIGPTLKHFGVNNAVMAPRLMVYRGGQLIASNETWYRQSGITALVAAQRAAGTYALMEQDGDAALVATLEPGSYTLQYRLGDLDTPAVGLIEAYDIDPGYSPSRVVNMSSRLFVGKGEQAAIPGLVVRGTGTKTYLIRAVGPGLGKFGVEGVLADPRIVISGGRAVSFSNDDWETSWNRAEISQLSERLGAFALDSGSKDAALLVTLAAGSYTVLVSGAADSTGIALVEIYEVPDSR